MIFARPEALVLLLLLLPLAILARRSQRRGERFMGTDAASRLGASPESSRAGIRRRLILLGLFFLVLAAARPQWGVAEVEVQQEGLDIVVCLDISRSMLAEDVSPSRLVRARAALGEFVERRRGDRVGLVFFAGAAFPQCPLTVDYSAARLFLAQAQPDLLSSQGTDIGAALEVARSLYDEEGGRHRVVLLVSDGEDFGEAARRHANELAGEGIQLFALGVGDLAGSPIPLSAGGFVTDEGRVVMSRLDEDGLADLAESTGGAYARLGSGGGGLVELEAEMATKETRRFATQQVTRHQERFRWPLLVALLCLILAPSLADRKRSVAMVLLLGFLFVPADAAAWDPIQKAARAAQLGREALAAGDSLRGLQELLKATQLAPEDARTHLALGEALAVRGESQAALDAYARAHAVAPSGLRALALYDAGTTALAAGDAEAALTAFRTAILEGGAEGQLREDLLYNLELAQSLLEEGQEGDDEQENSEFGEDGEDSSPQDNEESPPDSSQGKPSPPDSTSAASPDSSQLPPPDPAEADSTQADAAVDSLANMPLPEGMTAEEAMRLLQALDSDEQELLRSLQRRLRAGPAPGGKEW